MGKDKAWAFREIERLGTKSVKQINEKLGVRTIADNREKLQIVLDIKKLLNKTS